jgi:hypothetical protein
VLRRVCDPWHVICACAVPACVLRAQRGVVGVRAPRVLQPAAAVTRARAWVWVWVWVCRCRWRWPSQRGMRRPCMWHVACGSCKKRPRTAPQCCSCVAAAAWCVARQQLRPPRRHAQHQRMPLQDTPAAQAGASCTQCTARAAAACSSTARVRACAACAAAGATPHTAWPTAVLHVWLPPSAAPACLNTSHMSHASHHHTHHTHHTHHRWLLASRRCASTLTCWTSMETGARCTCDGVMVCVCVVWCVACAHCFYVPPHDTLALNGDGRA